MQDLMNFINQHMLLSLAVIVVFLLLIIVEFLRAKQNASQLTPLQATQLINHENAIVIDIRSRDQFEKGHIIDAKSMTTEEMRQAPKKLEKFKGKPLIIVCNVGTEGQKIAASLYKEGYNAYVLAGGIRAWRDAQMPLIKG